MEGAGIEIRSFGSLICRNALPRSPDRLPGLCPDRVRKEPLRGRLPSAFEDGGFDEVEESFDSRSTSAWTCVFSSAIWTSNRSIRLLFAANWA